MSLNFEDIFNKYHHRILRYTARMTSPEEAEGITQEVFIKVARNLEKFKGESSLSTWIYRIARNTALDRLKSTARKENAPLMRLELRSQNKNPWTGEQAMDPEIDPVRNEMNQCIREYIEKLAPDYRAVLLLSEIEGMKNKAIAETLGISLETAKIRLHRGRQRLKRELEKGCDFYKDKQHGFSCDRKKTLG